MGGGFTKNVVNHKLVIFFASMLKEWQLHFTILCYTAQESVQAVIVASVASVVVIIIVAAVSTAAVITTIVLWKKRYVKTLKLSAAQISTIGKGRQYMHVHQRAFVVIFISADNVMYTATNANVTFPNNKADASTIYEPLKDDESSNVHGGQAAYEVPDISGAQCYNETLVRIHLFAQQIETSLPLF